MRTTLYANSVCVCVCVWPQNMATIGKRASVHYEIQWKCRGEKANVPSVYTNYLLGNDAFVVVLVVLVNGGNTDRFIEGVGRADDGWVRGKRRFASDVQLPNFTHKPGNRSVRCQCQSNRITAPISALTMPVEAPNVDIGGGARGVGGDWTDGSIQQPNVKKAFYWIHWQWN